VIYRPDSGDPHGAVLADSAAAVRSCGDVNQLSVCGGKRLVGESRDTNRGMDEGGCEMRRRLTLVLVMLVALSLAVAAPATAKKPLRATTHHDFLGAEDIPILRVRDNLQLLGWQGTITGDIDGCIEWWFHLESFVDTGQATHYNETVEVHEGACPEGDPAPAEGDVILAADGSGTTTNRHMKNSTWRANGTVTIAEGDYESWLGRNVHESGHFVWDEESPPNPLAGTSDYRIN
jgi:hypothetical protein